MHKIALKQIYLRYKKSQIRIICAWCKKVISNPNGIIDSHGICKKCDKENVFFKKSKDD